ncbi:MAG: acetolactate decarboxylase [Phycisphaerae bacterium]|nr:acetolactate decarboxylase [Phycisphaerae bacterium]
MKRFHIFCFVLLCFAAFLPGCDEPGKDQMYQVSTLQALMLGLYDGDTTVEQLRQRGNHGIGTFNALHGEMALLEGKVYRVDSDGKVTEVSPETKTPFACVTMFEPDVEYPLSGGRDYEQLKTALDAWLPTTNLPYAVRITGTFQYVKTRSVPKQSKPYPPLAEVAKTQPTFEFENVEGIMLGFRLPEYLAGVNMAGYHLHFLTKDRKGGGHVLEFNASNAVVEADDCTGLFLKLPDAKTFTGVDLSEVKEEDIRAVESTTQPASQPTTQNTE